MWRTQRATPQQGRCILNLARRQLSAEAAPKPTPPKPTPPPSNIPPRKTGGFGIFKILGVSIPLAGVGLVSYAYLDKEFRQTLENTLPYAKETLGAILPPIEQEAAPVWPHLNKGIDNGPIITVQTDTVAQPLAQPVQSEATPVEPQQNQSSNTFILDDPEKKLTEEIIKLRENPLHGLTAPEIPTQQSYMPAYQKIDPEQLVQQSLDEETPSYTHTSALTPQKEKEKKSSGVDKRAIEHELRKMENEEKSDNAALEVVIHKLVTNSEGLSEEAVRAQQDYASSVRNHTKLLRQAMDDASDILQKDAQWEAVAIAFKEREHAKERADELVAESKRTIEKLRSVLTDGKNKEATKKNPAIVPASKKVNEILKDINSSNAQIRQAEAEANVMLKYKDLVDKGKKQFQQEIESLLPDVKIASGKKLSEDELNALIAHAHRRIEQLQRQIAEHVAMERQRVHSALEAQRQEGVHLTNSAVLDERSRMVQEFEIEHQKMEMEYLVKLEAEVRKQLARQAAAHSDHIKDVLSVQQDQLNTEFNREMNAKLLEEREKFQTEVAGWISRLKGIEAAVDARADSEKLARSAQDLWLACIALNSILHFGSESEGQGAGEPVPLRTKVEAIVNSGMKHPFVETVARSIPEDALDTGISTEEQLKSRFERVARICRRLGLVQSPNTSMYQYMLSYFHSFLVFDHVKAESATDEIDLSSMDNFDLLAHAQFWMGRGNLELALKFMSQLGGESGRAARDWIQDARLLLETKQCAQTLTAFASATGLANTF